MLLLGGFAIAVVLFTLLDLLRVWQATSFFPFVKHARSAYFIFFAIRFVVMSTIYFIAYFVPSVTAAAVGKQFELNSPFIALIYGIGVPLVYITLLERITWNVFATRVGVRKEFEEFKKSVNEAVSQFGKMALISKLLKKKTFDEAITCFSRNFVGPGKLDTDTFKQIVKGAKDYEEEFGQNSGIDYLLNKIGKSGVDDKTVFNVVRQCSS
jgi:heme/copper-type cytochrome/quinol oxidase subunit 2